MTKPSNSGSTISPFLAKCYEMVDDESVDSIISWGQSYDSFVIWNLTEFTRDLLPKYFKHSNFSSFMRQLNIYGFRKVDTDRWEFANEKFIKGQQHLLKDIKRRKNIQVSAPKDPQLDQPSKVPDKVDYTALKKQVQTLETDKRALMQELSKVRERQESSKNKLLVLGERLQGMENNQQQLLSFLVMVMQSPGLLVQLLQPRESSWRVAESGKITMDHGTESENTAIPEGSIVRYQPLPGDAPSPTATPLSDSDKFGEHDFSFDGVNDFFMNFDFSSSPLHQVNERLPSTDNSGSLIRPELDLAKLEQFLLSSPSRDPAVEPHFDGDDIFAMELELELENELEKEMEPTLCTIHLEDYEPTCSACNGGIEQSPNLETLTEKLGSLYPGE